MTTRRDCARALVVICGVEISAEYPVFTEVLEEVYRARILQRAFRWTVNVGYLERLVR